MPLPFPLLLRWFCLTPAHLLSWAVTSPVVNDVLLEATAAVAAPAVADCAEAEPIAADVEAPAADPPAPMTDMEPAAEGV